MHVISDVEILGYSCHIAGCDDINDELRPIFPFSSRIFWIFRIHSIHHIEGRDSHTFCTCCRKYQLNGGVNAKMKWRQITGNSQRAIWMDEKWLNEHLERGEIKRLRQIFVGKASIARAFFAYELSATIYSGSYIVNINSHSCYK